MRKKNNFIPSDKNTVIVLSSLFGVILIAFLCIFFICLDSYYEFDLDYSDLKHEQLTFESYNTIIKRTHKHNTVIHEVYFEELEKPLYFSSIANKKINVEELKKLNQGAEAELYFRENSFKDYDYVVCEMTSGDTVILSLSDYVKANQNNQLLGMVFCSIAVIGCAFMVITAISRIKKMQEYPSLGRVVMEHKIFGNQIRVYNSPSLCSLTVNGKVRDQYRGVVASKFVLKSKIVHNDQTIIVEAKMGHLYMTLFCDGKAVCKKFMGFG